MDKLPIKITEKTLYKNVGKLSKIVLRNLNPLEVLHEYFEYQKTLDEQKTAREHINAKRDIAIKSIEAQKEILLDYFNKRFNERKDSLEKFFTLLDNSIKEKDDKQLDVALAGILGILKDNPLGDFQTFKENMLMPNYKIEL
ncbi:MAG: hypothetical protein C0425_10020 [Chlorobiaceae bacterium]|nr:hypothetical protein [Chlorobiaceae bacterium]MBA4310655.1 hypothetical protein [Chlorobiaceae bacterium]